MTRRRSLTYSRRIHETGPEEAAAGQLQIEDRYKVLFQSHPNGHAGKLDQVYAIGGRVCAISEGSMMQNMHLSPWIQVDRFGSPWMTLLSKYYIAFGFCNRITVAP